MPEPSIIRRVVAHCHVGAALHERQTNLNLARWLAEILGWPFDGDWQEPMPRIGMYLVPTRTLIGEQRLELGVSGAQDLLGGHVQQAFMASKAISHPLPRSAAYRPVGWNPQFCRQVRQVVLPGLTVFDIADARRIARQYLGSAELRVKQVQASGGVGQAVLRTAQDLEHWLGQLDSDTCRQGLVLEENLHHARTYSVGQVLIDGLLMSYQGRQYQRPNPRGEPVYAGSELWLARGDYTQLLQRDLDPQVRQAVEHARIYDAAATACLPGFFASRRNYDVVCGLGHDGRSRLGVLEQSWRVGGATGAELAALQVFRQQPQVDWLRARTCETDQEQLLPPDAVLLYRGPDEAGGFLLKYAQVQAHGG
ncbi:MULTISPECIES: DUF3182 family protein [unclassified Pseudomonas]|uniref:DUF3182 family protein n=1 Tax=unclassified Pseudomonas TaxID=196821 RepID=UPI000CD09D5E|nr:MULTISPECIES: DUF3182 family protein [unclassified Pseudomonas]POA52546.1 DUF3182 domain-containing protein [Pseudomonas sp. FW507-12TSA]